MSDIRAFFKVQKSKTKDLRAQFPEGFCYITSLADPARGANARGGVVTEVSLDLAAKHLIEGSARLSTPEEVESQRARGESFLARVNAQIQGERKPTITLKMENQ